MAVTTVTPSGISPKGEAPSASGSATADAANPALALQAAPKPKEDNTDELLMEYLLASSKDELSGGMGVGFMRQQSSAANNINAGKIANRAKKIEKWEKMAESDNAVARRYAKTRLGIARAQDKLVAKTGGAFDKLGEKFPAVARVGGFFKSTAEVEKGATGLAKVGRVIKPALEVMKLAKPLLKVGKFVGLGVAAVGGVVAVVAASPVIATVGVVVGVVAAVGTVAGVALSAYSTYESTHSYMKAAVSGADFIAPVNAGIDLYHGNVKQAAVDGTESLLGFGGGTAGKLAQNAINAVHYVGRAQTAVGVAQTAATVADLAEKNPELAKKIAATALDVAATTPRHIGEVADIAGQTISAQRGNKVEALAQGVINNNGIRTAALKGLQSNFLSPSPSGAKADIANAKPTGRPPLGFDV